MIGRITRTGRREAFLREQRAAERRRREVDLAILTRLWVRR